MDLSDKTKALLISTAYTLVMFGLTILTSHLPINATIGKILGIICMKMTGFAIPLYAAIMKVGFK